MRSTPHPIDTEEPDMTDPQTTQSPQAEETEAPTVPLTAESLVEEVSIDGMCGVY